MQNITTISRKRYTLREKCSHSKLFWSAFSRIRAEHGEILRLSPHSVRMRENADQNNSKCGNFLHWHKSHIWAHIFLFWSNLGQKRTVKKIKYTVFNNFQFPLRSGKKWEKKANELIFEKNLHMQDLFALIPGFEIIFAKANRRYLLKVLVL